MKKWVYLTFSVVSILPIKSWGQEATATARGQVEQSFQQLNQRTNPEQCGEFQDIQTYCLGNGAYQTAQIQLSIAEAAAAQRDNGIGDNALRAEMSVREIRQITGMVRSLCEQATQRCETLCQTHAQNEQRRAQIEIAQNNLTAARQHQTNQQQAQTTGQQCTSAGDSFQTAEQAFSMDLEQVLAALMALKELLGIGDAQGSAPEVPDEEEEDECEGQYASLLIQCQDGDNGPSTSRASTSGPATLGRGGGPGLNLSNSEVAGEPGGTNQGGNDNGGGAGGGFGAAGGGFGGGLGGTGAGATTAAGEKEGLDTDIHKGFHGAGGFGGGGGGGGGSSGGSGFSPRSLGNVGPAGLNKAALQKKLNKYAKDSARRPASAGGANGPFDDNWAIVNKAYKKNSSSMFHQQ